MFYLSIIVCYGSGINIALLFYSDGLLLYLDDGGYYDFLELKLVNKTFDGCV